MRESARLRRTKDVQRVRLEGARRADRFFAVTAAPRAELGASRLALSVPARVGSAVRRNRARRRARAVFAAMLPHLSRPVDLLVAVREPVVEAPFAELVRSAEHLLREHGLLPAAAERASGGWPATAELWRGRSGFA